MAAWLWEEPGIQGPRAQAAGSARGLQFHWIQPWGTLCFPLEAVGDGQGLERATWAKGQCQLRPPHVRDSLDTWVSVSYLPTLGTWGRAGAVMRTTWENPCTQHLQGLSGPTGHGQESCGRGRSHRCSALPTGEHGSVPGSRRFPATHTPRDELQSESSDRCCTDEQHGCSSPTRPKGTTGGEGCSLPWRPETASRIPSASPPLWLPSCTYSDCSWRSDRHS